MAAVGGRRFAGRALLSLVQETSAPTPRAAGADGFDSLLVRMSDLRADPSRERRDVVAPDGAAATGSTLAAIPLRLVSETPAKTLADALRARFGPRAVDCLILERPVWLSSDWRDNNHDHARKLVAAWNALERLVEAGVARALGVANAGEAVIDVLLKHASVAPALNQIEFHPYLTSASLVRHCRDHGVAVQALRWLGPLDGAAGHRVLGDPQVVELAQAHGRAPAQIVVKWCLSRVDGLAVDGSEAALVGSLQELSQWEMRPGEVALLDGLDCGYRIDRSPSTLASIYGSLAAEPMRVERAETKELAVGCHKILYAPVSRSESFNRRFSYLVWRNVFNLPATVKYAVRRPKLSAISARIRSNLDANGFALSDVRELGCEAPFQRLASKAAGLVSEARNQGNRTGRYWHKANGDLAQELATVPVIKDAVDAYFQLETVVDDAFVITVPARLEGARKQQLWHSDVEDLYTVKVYTFLTDVDGFSGALEYIAESHPKGRFALDVAELWKHSFVKDPTPTYTFQVPDEMLFRHVRPDLLRRLEGPAGTVVIFDARGLHRGGHVLRGSRQVAVTSHIAPNQAHPWRGPTSLWSSLWYRFRWETNATLKEPAR
jgi:diketogulonate reductase-like aldo/keto reductase